MRTFLLTVLFLCSVQAIHPSVPMQEDVSRLASTYALRIMRTGAASGTIYAEGETQYSFLILCVKKDQGGVIEEGDEVGAVGFEAHHLGVNTPLYGYITRIEVNPELQGQGIGSLLLQAAIRELAEHGCDYIGLTVHPLDMDRQHPDFAHNVERLRGFYGRFDFAPIDWHDHSLFYERLFRFISDPEQIAMRDAGMHLLAAKPFLARLAVPEVQAIEF